jgi:type I restriction enzyme S subunit
MTDMKQGATLSLPNGWEEKRVQDIAKVVNGYAFDSKDFKATNTIKSIKITNVGVNEFIEEIENYLPEKHKETLQDYQVKEGNIVIALTRTIISAGLKVAIVPESYNGALLNQRVAALVPNEKLVNQKFLYNFLTTDNVSKYVLAHVNTLMQPNLSINDLRNLPIPLPPLPEQQRIVSILDQAFSAIERSRKNAERCLSLSKALFESYLQGVFEEKGDVWVKKTLGDVCEFSQGIQRDIKLQSEFQKANQVRFLRIVDFTQGNELPRYIDNPGEKYILNQNDVSLVRYGASTGFVCRGLEGALANNLFRIIPKSKKEISNDFLFIYLSAPFFQNVIKASMNGAAMPAISFGLIKDVPFPIISIEEQQTIVARLDALSAETKRLEAIYQQKINNLEELKKSVLQKAFAGELKTETAIAL